MKVQEVTPNVDTAVWLAGAQFADAFRIAVDGPLDARIAAQRMMGRSPRWVEALLSLRNALVAPFGLKTSGAGEKSAGGLIGLFPVLSETPERLVAGFDDHHLDFRVVVDVFTSGGGQQVTATTLVRTNNWLGRIYLAIILPFHRLVVRSLLRQVAA
ncbi:DUF2867 domain-containing protein [Bradyrhizobium erythrophlei]|uniref:DUF2867 domain-containing protein n=1 Tax=Bradyrhizobium erythrophlei TaxID=1437360 RepID=A0A1M5IUU5_9BRAD|nr:DUF2867 domain-containing protein [Bradyrhizobium erythrophlei]SHG31809.1 Protein of unknown function [Bradyrhizobium erythrophlei]